MLLRRLFRFLFGRGLESLANVAVKDPLTDFDSYNADVEIDMPDYALEEKMTIAELGKFCVALANSVERGFSLEEGVRIGRRAVDMRIGKHSLLHFHLWEGEDCHELQVRMAKVDGQKVAMHFMAEQWAAGKVVAALNASKGVAGE